MANNSSVYFLIELKRPPIISNLCYSLSRNQPDTGIETREPGTVLLGHADAWIFRLHDSEFNRYCELFQCFRAYSLD